jgi:hypothetical protein
MRYELTMKRTAKPNAKKAAFVVRSLTLTLEVDAALQDLAQDATDFVGRSISASAVVRGLIGYAARQNPEWIRNEVFSFIEQELKAGVLWGKQSKRTPKK